MPESESLADVFASHLCGVRRMSEHLTRSADVPAETRFAEQDERSPDNRTKTKLQNEPRWRREFIRENRSTVSMLPAKLFCRANPANWERHRIRRARRRFGHWPPVSRDASDSTTRADARWRRRTAGYCAEWQSAAGAVIVAGLTAIKIAAARTVRSSACLKRLSQNLARTRPADQIRVGHPATLNSCCS